MWADQIRTDGAVRWPYPVAARSLIHEADIARVAVRALTQDGHTGQTYVLTGQQTLIQTEQVHAIGEAIDRPLRLEEIPATRPGQGWSPPSATRRSPTARWAWAAFVTVTGQVSRPPLGRTQCLRDRSLSSPMTPTGGS